LYYIAALYNALLKCSQLGTLAKSGLLI